MDTLIIALNKVDLFPEGAKDPALLANVKKLRGRFKHTKFGAYLPIVSVAAAPKASDESPPYGIENLINTILTYIQIPQREAAKKQHFQFAIDHCFQIKG